MHIKRTSGFTILEVVMSLAILGIFAVIVMDLNSGLIDSDVRSISDLDYIQLTREFGELVQDDNCTASLADPGGPSVVDFDAVAISGDVTNGKEIKLYFSDNAIPIPARNFLKLEAGQVYGNIQITAIRLYLPDYNGSDITGDRVLPAEIAILGTKKAGLNRIINIPPLKKSVALNVTTTAAGTTVNGCGVYGVAP